jgi:hypothetical protein
VCSALSDCGSARSGSASLIDDPQGWLLSPRSARPPQDGGSKAERCQLQDARFDAHALQRSQLDPVLAGHRSARKQILDAGRSGGRCFLARPTKLASISPDPVHDDRQLAGNGDDSSAQPPPLREGDAPRLQRRPALRPREQRQRCLIERARGVASPDFEIAPFRSTSPDAYFLGVSPR